MSVRVGSIAPAVLLERLSAQRGMEVSRRTLAVVDVRDDDFEGGHLEQALHVPAHEFHDDVAAHVPSLVNKSTVAFHCMFSQVRGPKAARRFAYALEAYASLSDPAPTLPEVVIVEGGFYAVSRLQGEYPEEFADMK